MMMSALELFLHDAYVGTVEAASRDQTRVTLSVDAGYRQGVLLSESFATMPGRSPASAGVSNFLGGYVPEGNHRERMAAKRRVDKEDLFALLSEFGGSVAGAVTLSKQGEPGTTEPAFEPVSDRELATLLKQALDESDQGIADDSRSTLPGYQPKVLVARFDGQWFQPHGGAHSTHILKPQVPSRPHRIYDEAYSHQLTRHMGLSRFGSEVRTAGRMTYLEIERFDRTIRGDRVLLHHQEDLAQALGLDWRNTEVKFQERNWPADPKRASAQRVGELLGSIPGGQAAVEAWVRQLTYHVAIGNNDAHAKNLALMHLATGTELTQVYDAVPNLFQEGIVNWDLALAVDGEFDQRRMSTEGILAEVATWGVIAATRAEALVAETLTSLDEALSVVEPDKDASPGMVERLQWNVTRLLGGTQISEPKR
ncbi:type II toxin-antitoxin system HipA family toxin [Demequina aurantiaca]|uniref:type II toxin-antitoxin system HipA family toxin n=1 Tax=Demequina aurantiaca TaxID=676200 RepID=UPI003D3406C2